MPLARVLGWKKAAYVSSRMGHLLVLVEGADVKFTKGLVCSTYVVYLYVPSIYLSRIYSKIVHLPDAPSPVRASLRLSSLVSFFSFLSLFVFANCGMEYTCTSMHALACTCKQNVMATDDGAIPGESESTDGLIEQYKR